MLLRFRACLLALSCTLLYSTLAHCRHGLRITSHPEALAEKGPWFTGPLLTPAAHVVPPGYINLEPYLFVDETYGSYDSEWHSHSTAKTFSLNPQLFFQIGVVKNVDFQISPQMFYTRKQGESSTQFGDLPIVFGFQLLQDKPGYWWPAIRLIVRESFPTGKFQKLNAHKNGTDGVGSGAFSTDVGLVMSRLFHTGGAHYLNTRIAFIYNALSNTHVKGFNTYGGGFGTSGTVHPGNSMVSLLGLEFTLALNWALALDVANTYVNKTTFSGKRGVTSAGVPAAVGGPSSSQWSLAPAIEYNFNESLGIIAGAWFTVAGRNSAQFASGVIAVNLYTSYKKAKSK
ncbi:MAG: hypothetical protein ACHQT8_02250 [Chlamydiales bacterium]